MKCNMGSNGSRKTKIVINALSARTGGGQTYLINLLESLPEEFPVEIFVLAPDSVALPRDKPNVERIPVGLPVENPFARAIWERLYLSRLLKRLDANLLFCPGGLIGSRVPSGCKTVTMFRNMIPFDAVQRERYQPGYMRARNFI